MFATGVADRQPRLAVARVLAAVVGAGLRQTQPHVVQRVVLRERHLRLRVDDLPGDLRPQLDPVDPRVGVVGQDVVLDVVVVVAVRQQAGLLVALAERRGVDVRLDRPVLDRLRRILEDEVPRRGRVAVGVDVAGDGLDLEPAVLERDQVLLRADDVVPLLGVERPGVERVAAGRHALALVRRVLAVEPEVVERDVVALAVGLRPEGEDAEVRVRHRVGHRAGRQPCRAVTGELTRVARAVLVQAQVVDRACAVRDLWVAWPAPVGTPSDLRAQLDPVDPGLAGVGDRVELDVVLAVHVGDQPTLAVAAVHPRVDLRLDRPVVARRGRRPGG